MKLSLPSFILLLAFFASFSCSSRKLKKDYEVVDASHQEIPLWVEDVKEWSEDEDADREKFRYFFFQSEPNTSRVAACETAKARAATNIASEVGQTIRQNFSQSLSQHSQHEDKTSAYLQDRLTKDVSAKLVGAQVHRTYWEKRRYLKDLGAKTERDAYVCMSLARISIKQLDLLLDHAQTQLKNTTEERPLEEKIQEAIEKTRSELMGL